MSRSTPHPIDRHVGARVRLIRTVRGMSQVKLGEAAGVTFQQIQKYEKGHNGIRASRLHGIAEALDVPVAKFFEGYGDGMNDHAPTRLIMELARGFERLEPDLQQALVKFIRTIAPRSDAAA